MRACNIERETGKRRKKEGDGREKLANKGVSESDRTRVRQRKRNGERKKEKDDTILATAAVNGFYLSDKVESAHQCHLIF